MSEAKDDSKSHPRAHLLKRPPSTQSIIKELRQNFQERLRIARSTQQCKNRNLYSTIVSEVQTQFKNIIPVEEELNTEEMISLLLKTEKEINEEAFQEEADAYERITEQEVDMLLENYVCQICNMPIQSPVNSSYFICSGCSNLHFSNESL